MSDVCSQLHPHVVGNHLWSREKPATRQNFNQEMFNLDQQTVDPSRLVSLRSDRKRLERESIESHCLADKTSELSGFWVTNVTKCVIIDTPSLNDSDNEDTEHIWGMVEFLRRRGWVHSIVPTQV